MKKNDGWDEVANIAPGRVENTERDIDRRVEKFN